MRVLTAHLPSRVDCEKYVDRAPPSPAAEAAASAAAAATAAAAAADSGAELTPHCAPLVAGVLLLLVSDRPNQFLCHYFESALLHGESARAAQRVGTSLAAGALEPARMRA